MVRRPGGEAEGAKRMSTSHPLRQPTLDIIEESIAHFKNTRYPDAIQTFSTPSLISLDSCSRIALSFSWNIKEFGEKGEGWLILVDI